MNVIARNIVSSLLMILFSVVSVTGVMMFFKIRILSGEVLHIWLGFVFVLISCLHVMKNWNNVRIYFTKRSTHFTFLLGLCVVVVFVAMPLFQPQERTINPKGLIFQTMMSAPLSKLAAFTDIDEELMVKELANRNISASGRQSILEIAKANDTTNDAILKIVFSVPAMH
ncbi:DUF4405 domain-containing protein [Sulfurospirillum cavolei]|uniref:DUF4405 domain-containing protein n=1 Tax=Sulfurospirillum cavolei TaxID=366522 RepID=UPI0007649DFA|nr:DUF4405 domain-containing protein [Sulfurospirillum cavolei]